MPYKNIEDKRLGNQRFVETHPEYVREQGRKHDRKRSKTEARKAYMRQWWKDHAEKRKEYNVRRLFHHNKEHSQANKEWYQKNKERILAMRKEYYRTHKEAHLARAKIYVKAHKREVQEMQKKWRLRNIEECRRRSRECAKRAYQKNPEKFRVRAIHAVAKRIALIKESTDPAEAVELFIWRLRNNPEVVCAYCGKSIFGIVQIDHIVPISRGGKHQVANLCAACPACNASKKDKTLEEWSEWKAALESERKE